MKWHSHMALLTTLQSSRSACPMLLLADRSFRILPLIILASFMSTQGLAAGLMATEASSQSDMNMLPVHSPFIVKDATVRGPVGQYSRARPDRQRMGSSSYVEQDSEDVLSWAGSRSLLHGTKKPGKYPKCTKCACVLLDAIAYV